MDVDELYGLPIDRFVAERGAVARGLRADGKREEAARVSGLRKPSVAAWATRGERWPGTRLITRASHVGRGGGSLGRIAGASP